MRFSSFDKLRTFDVVARRLSFSAAAEVLHLTKGAVSYQIGTLEADLGFALFTREHRGIALTAKGEKLWHVSQAAFHDMEREIATLREQRAERITIGMTTYFASRWLSPRLMTFMVEHPDIALRLQPMIGLDDLRGQGIDMAVRWGKGGWTDVASERLFHCAARATAGAAIARRIAAVGLAAALPEMTLLHDRDDSHAWADWHSVAGLPYRSTREGLVIPDPNVRVQAVIDGQGMALNDALVRAELGAGVLFEVSEVQMDDYGYFLVYPSGALGNPSLAAFHAWIMTAAREWESNAT